jgi:hypothetical protein
MSKNRLIKFQKSNFASEKARGPNPNLLYFVMIYWCLEPRLQAYGVRGGETASISNLGRRYRRVSAVCFSR